MTELWRDIPSFPKYQASNLGNIRSLKSKDSEPRVLSPCLNKATGYLFISVFNEGKQFKRPIHYFISLAWLTPPSDELRRWEVNHKNLDKLDNKVENLELVTKVGNVQHAVENGAYSGHSNQHWKKGRHYLRTLTPDHVKAIRILRDAGFSLYKIAIVVGCDHKTVDGILKKRIYADW